MAKKIKGRKFCTDKDAALAEYLRVKDDLEAGRQPRPKVDDRLTVTTVTLEDEHEYHSTSALAVGDFAGTGTPQIAVGNSNGFLWMLAFEDARLEVLSEWKVPSGGAIGWGLAAGELDERKGSELMVGTI